MAIIGEPRTTQDDPPAPLLAARDAELTTRELISRMERGGWPRSQAGNLVALLYGIRPARAGWTVHEIEHLRFLRALVDAGLEH